jgi:putative transcriptional regulator
MGRTSAQGRVNAVRAARQAAGLTQAELATDVGVSRQTVVAVEAGDYAPSVYLALSLATRLATTVEALFDPALETTSGGPDEQHPAGPARADGARRRATSATRSTPRSASATCGTRRRPSGFQLVLWCALVVGTAASGSWAHRRCRTSVPRCCWSA